ncbi:GNAT family N-acetyltransferase [Polymorphum gilvum]|nr:GNAT family N-acetyltransferase [Polymorphum gilvum]
MTLKLRPARLSDTAPLTDILHRSKASWGYPADKMDQFRAEVRITPATIAAQSLTVAERDGRPVGFAGGEAKADHFYLHFLFVAPEHQRRGIGRLLLAAAEDRARVLGLARILLESDVNAVGFYTRHGFSVLSERDSTMAEGHRIPLMNYALPPMVRPLSGVDLRLAANQPWPFELANRPAIEAHWREAQRANPHLWNGRTLKLVDWTLAGGRLCGACVETSFAAFLAWRDWGCPDRAAWNAFGSALVRSRDGALLYGIMAPTTANAGLVYPPGGSLDLADLAADGSVDVLGSIARELAEETGLAAADAHAGALFAVLDGPRLSVARAFRFDRDADDLRAAMLRHSRASAEQELSDIVILREPADLPRANVPAFARALAGHVLAGHVLAEGPTDAAP